MIQVTLSQDEQYTLRSIMSIFDHLSPKEQVVLAQLFNEAIVKAGNDVANIIGERPLLKEALLAWAKEELIKKQAM